MCCIWSVLDIPCYSPAIQGKGRSIFLYNQQAAFIWWLYLDWVTFYTFAGKLKKITAKNSSSSEGGGLDDAKTAVITILVLAITMMGITILDSSTVAYTPVSSLGSASRTSQSRIVQRWWTRTPLTSGSDLTVYFNIQILCKTDPIASILWCFLVQ